MKTATLNHQGQFPFYPGLTTQKSNLISGTLFHYTIKAWALCVVCSAIVLLPVIAVTEMINIAMKVIRLLLKPN